MRRRFKENARHHGTKERSSSSSALQHKKMDELSTSNWCILTFTLFVLCKCGCGYEYVYKRSARERDGSVHIHLSLAMFL